MKNRSFTLIELLVVIAVIGLISSIVLVSMKGTTTKAKIAKALDFSQSVNHALGAYAVGIWNFDDPDDPSQALDASGYGNHGAINGAVYTSDTPHAVVGAGQGKYALSFDGTSDYVNAGAGSSLNFGTGDYTLAFWFKWTGPGIYGGFAMKGAHWGAHGNPFVFWGRPNGMNVGVSGGGVLGEMGFNTGGEDRRWHHFVLTRNSETITVYTDTRYLNSMTISGLGNTDTGSPLLIGRGAGMIGENNFFKGLIDEVRIYSWALTTAEIQKHYAEGLKKYKNLVTK